jgi:hypothetical protein
MTRNLVFLLEWSLLCTRKVRKANFKGNAVSPRSLHEVYPEFALSLPKGEVEGVGMKLSNQTREHDLLRLSRRSDLYTCLLKPWENPGKIGISPTIWETMVTLNIILIKK